MADKTNPTENSISNFLPRFYRTEANKKFLQATVEQLVKPGKVKKINGYVGRRNAKAATGKDIFVSGVNSFRENYQLEPTAIVQDTLDNTLFLKDYQDYINQLGVLGSNVKNHSRLNEQEFYSWNPHIAWDKFVNFQQYYWLPYGPDTITIYGQQRAIQSTYTVKWESQLGSKAFLFTPNGLTRNPSLTLYRGQTYKFEIDSPGEPFSIKFARSTGSTDRYIDGSAVDAFAVESGTVTFVVPDDAPDVLFYVSENDINLGGIFKVLDIKENTEINVQEELLGKKTYKLPSGLSLSNGMKLKFGGNVLPAEYAVGQYYVEGVGDQIKLVAEASLELVFPYTEEVTILFDDTKFDAFPFNSATTYAGKLDYIVINRASIDKNPWSRYNRWFHQDVITSSAEYNGNIPSLDQASRAVRPIIEFEADLKLFNFGLEAGPDVDLVDDYTVDVFSTIEGTVGYNIDGIDLVEGQRILFTADTDSLVKNKIYRVSFITVQDSIKQTRVRQLHLVLEHEPVLNEVIVVKQGLKYQGSLRWFDGSEWNVAQNKTALNQTPLFDLVNSDGISFGDKSTYDGTTFDGTKLFSYKVGTGTVDSNLGFALSYKNINNTGDIVFNFNAILDEFQYKDVEKIIKESVSTGFLVKSKGNNVVEYKNGWEKSSIDFEYQPALRVYKNSGKVNNFDIDLYDNKANLSDLKVRVYINGIRLDTSLWSIVDGAVYKKLVLTTDVAESDIVTIKCFSKQPINSNGYYEIPINLQNNPLNNAMSDFTLGEVIDHVNSIVDNLENFSGAFPGNNNIRDLGNVSVFGTKFVQHSGPMGLSLYHLASSSNNIIKAIEKARDEYGQFKRNFISIAQNLGIDTNTKDFVDAVLEEINKDKPTKSPYYFSDTVPYGAAKRNDFTVLDYRILTYPLSEVFDVTYLSNKAVGVYLNGTQLIYGLQYEFSDQGFVKITAPLQNDDTVTIYEYDTTDGCFIPQTPTKLGIWPKYEPMIYEDTSLITPRTMIQGHDGSQVLAYGDYRDDLLLELEKRIFNNIKVQYDSSIFDIYDFIPGYSRDTDYSLQEFNEVLSPNFFKWLGLVDRDFTKPLSFDRTNTLTYNYRGHVAPDGREVPGYWRGIYRWMLDTDRPNLAPWECLGFTIQPTWWEEVYGPAPYTSDNKILWNDLAEGIIREPGQPIIRDTRFVRSFLKDRAPVDQTGNIQSPMLGNFASGVITPSSNGDYIFGDVSPVEAAWRRSSYFPFSVLITALLLKPSKAFGVLLDRSRIVRNLTGQLVYKDTGLRVRPKDVVLPNIYSSSTRTLTAGLVNYIVDYILSDNLKSYDQYQYDLQNIDFNLSYRLSGFTSKEKFNLILDSKSPTAVGGVFVPQENYKVILNSSSPIKKLTYSGIIITKLQDGFEIKGYSKTQPYFYYYPWTQSGNTINVGGISENFTFWTPGQRYSAGKIVKYNNVFYRTSVTHVAAGSFELANFQKLAALPILGGQNAVLRKRWDKLDVQVVPYGTKFRTIQEVVDFILGYGEYLSDQGFVFDDFNNNLSQITNWETSVKEFLFWTTQNWSSGEDKWDEWIADEPVKYGSVVRYNGDYYRALRDSTSAFFVEDNFEKLEGLSTVGSSVISLSPAAEKITIRTEYAVVDDILNEFNGYEVFRVDGTKIEPNFLNSFRNSNEVSFSPQGDDGIYGATFFFVQKEQVLVLDNTTLFNDTIYNPESGYRQERIKTSGYVSTDWYGGFDVPGFIFDQAKIMDWTPWNDYALGDIVKYKEFYYSALSAVDGGAEFVSSEWVKLTKKPEPELLPNWSYKASQFEDFYSLDSGNFDVGQQKMAQHLIGYQKRQYLENIIQDDVSEFKFYQGMIIEKGTQNSLNKLFDVLSAEGEESLKFFEEWAVRVGQYGATAGFEEIEFTLDESLFKNNPQGFELQQRVEPKLDFIIRQSPTDIYLKPLGYNSNPWPMNDSPVPYLRSAGYVRSEDVKIVINSLESITEYSPADFKEGDYVWCLFESKPTDWNVYRFTSAPIKITDITYAGTKLTVTTDKEVSLPVGTYVGIVRVTGAVCFCKIETIKLNSFTSTVTLDTAPNAPFDEQDTVDMFYLKSQRVTSIDDANTALPGRLKQNELLWTDSYNDNWAVWEYDSVYGKKTVANSSPSTGGGYGRAIATSQNGQFALVSTKNNLVIAYDKVPGSTTWLQRQTIFVPFIFQATELSAQVSGYFAETVATSKDSRWIALGSPNVSYASALNGVTDILGTTSSYVKQGVVSIYEKDSTNTTLLIKTIVSPSPASNQLFGSTLVFGNDELFIGADGYNSSAGRVYRYNYETSTDVETTYNPTGSFGTTLRVASTTGITAGMKIVGYGFNGHIVVEVVNATTLTISAEPDTAPAGTIEFTTTGWKYNSYLELPITLSSNDRFGWSMAMTDDSTLVVSAPGAKKVFVYKKNTSTGVYAVDQTITSTEDGFGEYVTISSTGNYIAVGVKYYDGVKLDQGSVLVYKKQTTGYQLVQTLVSPRPEVAGFFGTKVEFMNGDDTIVVFSANADSYKLTTFNVDGTTTFDNDGLTFVEDLVDSGRIDIFDKYLNNWVYSESLEVGAITDSVVVEGFIGDGYGTGFAVSNNAVVVGAPNAVDRTFKSGKVYSYEKTAGTYSWNVVRTNVAVPDVKKIKNAFLYNKKTSKLLTYLDVVDVSQGKIPGPADQELKFKTFYDPATYSIGTDEVIVDNGQAWTDSKVGLLWWDLRTAKFVDSYGGDVVYRNTTWNTLVDSATIDVCEWVKSNILPSAWDELADTEQGLTQGISGKSLYGNSAYSVKRRYDSISQTFKNTYYYWVKNKKTIPEVSFRTMSAQSVANLIENPKGNGYKYIALTGSNSFSLVNVKPLLEDKDVVLTVQYWTIGQTDQNIHNEWRLISNDENTSLPNSIEKKWFDSLCGKDENNRTIPDLDLPPKLRYGVQSRPRQSMFVNRFEALKQLVEKANDVLLTNQIVNSRDITGLDSFDPEPSIVSGAYDTVIDTDAEIRFVNVSTVRPATVTPVIQDGAIVGIEIVEAGNGFINAPYFTISGTGVDAKIRATINARGQITGAEIINKGRGYADNTTLSIRGYSVLVHSDSEALGRWSIYAYDTVNKVWARSQTQAYDTRRYWSYVDWYDSTVTQFTPIDHSVDIVSDLSSIVVRIGQLVKVRNTSSTGWLLLRKYAESTSIDWTQSYKVVGSQNGTIQLSEDLYKFADTTLGYDGALFDGDTFDNTAVAELRIILNSLKDDIFIDTLKQTYLDLFFVCLRYAFSEQNYLDWAFKTSFVRAQHNVGPLKQKVTYNNDNLADFQAYIDEVKPYRTKVREYVSEYTNLDASRLSMTDFDVLPVREGNQNTSIILTNVDGDIQATNPEILTYPWKHWLDNVGFEITDLVLTSNGADYLTEPVVRFEGGYGEGATARAFISNGKVNRVTLLSKGSGYLSAPKVVIDGGLSVDGTPATAIAKIGNSVIRSNLIKIKFDRTSQTYFITELEESETFTGTGSQRQFVLKWGPDVRIGKSSVTIDGVDALRDNYTLTIATSTTRGYTSYYGKITFETAPAKDAEIIVNYIKDWSLLNAADRIQYYYDPTTGQLGKDLSQLMSGIDYGGVVVTGLDFSVSSGWDSLPYFSDAWDSIDPTFDDYIIKAGLNSYQFELPYIPEDGVEINVYHNGTRIDDPNFGTEDQTNSNATMQTFVGDGINSLVELPSISVTSFVIGTYSTGDTVLEFDNVDDIQIGSLVLAPDRIVKDSEVVSVTGNVVSITTTASIDGTVLTSTNLTENYVGMRVSGSGIAAGTYVESVNLGVEAVAEIQTISVSGTATNAVSFLGSVIAGSTLGDSAEQIVIKIAADSAAIIAAWNLANPTELIENIEIDFNDGPAGTSTTLLITFSEESGDVDLIVQSTSNGIQFAESEVVSEGVDGTTSTAVISVSQTVSSQSVTFIPVVEISNALLGSIASGYEILFDGIPRYTLGVQPQGSDKLELTSALGIQIGDILSTSVELTTTDVIPFNTTVVSKDTIANTITLSNAITGAIANNLALTFGYNKLFFRKSTSDGSIKPLDIDYDTSLTGGDLAYSSATGLAADDIIVDGDGFVTPTSSSAPEEVVPGQITDAVAIKVFYRPTDGAAQIKVDNFIADGTTDKYSISQQPNSKMALVVKVDGEILNSSEYSLDYARRIVTLTNVPAEEAFVSLYSIGFSGANVLDIDYFIGNETTTEFITKAPWSDTISSVVYVNGEVTNYELFKTDSSYDVSNTVGIRFVEAPQLNDLVSYIIVEGDQTTFAVTSSEVLAPTGTKTVFSLTNKIGTSEMLASNVIVRVNQQILKPAFAAYFDIKSNRLNYALDLTKATPYDPDITDVSVYANGTLLNLGTDYTVDLSGITISINRGIYRTYKGTTLMVCLTHEYEYICTENSVTFTTPPASDDDVEVISSYQHNSLDIQRTSVTVVPNLEYTEDTLEFFNYKAISAGIFKLDRPVVDTSYVWITKNGQLLTPSIDYKVEADKQTVKLALEPSDNDVYEFITYGNNVHKTTMSYMQFKDMLNRTHFKRLSLRKQARLTQDLHYYDTTIYVDNAAEFDVPNPSRNIPGILEIEGERIEYFVKDGNTLSQLRRGTLGTGVMPVVPSGTVVQDIGPSETIPYKDEIKIEQITTTGNKTVDIEIVPSKADTTWSYDSDYVTSIPAGYGQNNEVEVFVGGYDTEQIWAPNISYTLGTIVHVGSYLYRCITDHTSTAVFSNDAANWQFFIGNIRLKKHPFKVHNVNQHPDSPEGDIQMDPDFSVDGESASIRLTHDLDPGTTVTVVRKTGKMWNGVTFDPVSVTFDSDALSVDEGNTTFDLRETSALQASNTKIASFLREEQGIWPGTYVSRNVGARTFDDNTQSFDSNQVTFDRGN